MNPPASTGLAGRLAPAHRGHATGHAAPVAAVSFLLAAACLLVLVSPIPDVGYHDAPAPPATPPRTEPVNEASPPEPAPPPAAFAPARPEDPLELIVVRENDPRLLCLAAPLASNAGGGGPRPAVVAVGSPPGAEAIDLVRRLNPRRALVLTTEQDPDLARRLEHLPADVWIGGGDLPQAAGALAKQFWKTANRIVLAPAEDPDCLLTASVLAVHLNAPLLPLGGRPQRLSEQLDALQAATVLAVMPEVGEEPAWAGMLKQTVTLLDPPAARRLVVEALGAANIRNVILAREPAGDGAAGAASWIAPHLSVCRGAPVVLCDEIDGRTAEQRVQALVREHKLAPRSVTILGDPASIGTVTVRDPARLGNYEVEVEPCSGPGAGGAATWGVGRIPTRTLRGATFLVARTIARDRLLARKRFRVLTVANPSTEYGPLPLCETVSRLTAEEFKNRRVAITESYGKAADHQATLQAATKARLILFQGHITDQLLFTAPTPPGGDWGEPVPDADPGFFMGEPTTGDQDPEPRDAKPVDGPEEPTDVPPLQPEPPVGDLDEPADPPEEHGERAEDPVDDPADPEPDGPAPAPEDAAPLPAPKPQPPLEGLPLVVLQSCHSLEEETARVVFERGGVALVGSTTNIHSASGSAFIKAFCDAALNREATAGEALRDARNYFFCLAELKAKRGHTQQAKVVRAALSFRLWGDPEMRVCHGRVRPPRRRPVRVRFGPPDRIVITLPARRLPECRTEKYRARMFPGSQAAGIVKSAKGRPRRRLMPLYFERLPLPDGFIERGFTRLRRAEDQGARAVFLIDDLRRHLYVAYFPKKERARATFTLQLEP